MATVEYDLDTSGGLMEQIQKLVAPPVSEEPGRRTRGRGREREYRRPGKAVNHDCCDACQEGGDLICCDRCPASFHLMCHDPPLCEEDLPPGEWICHRCKVAPPKEKDEDSQSTSSSQSSQSGKRPRGRPPRNLTPLDVDKIESEDDEEEGHPLKLLVKAARIMNPSQFEVPKSMQCNTPIPGSSKRRWWHKDSNRNGPKKLAHELDNGIVPLPAKVCFTCSRSCRIGPLLQCDYCPLLFHLDCLDPPMASMPSGRWMCPNHAEHFLDQKLLKSVTLTERVKLWDKYTGPINHHTAKLQFLQNAHREHPPFRIKVSHPRTHRIKVPAAIKAHYKDPPPLLPQMNPRPAAAERTDHHIATPEEQEKWLASVVSLQSSIAQHFAQRQIKREPRENTTYTVTSTTTKSSEAKPTASVIPVLKQERTRTPSPFCNEAASNIVDTQSDDKRPLKAHNQQGKQNSLPNGPLSDSKANRPVSLLSNNFNLPNGDLEGLESKSVDSLTNCDAPSDCMKNETSEPMEVTQGHDGAHHVVKLNMPGSSAGSTSVHVSSQGHRNLFVNTLGKGSGSNSSATRVVTVTTSCTRTLNASSNSSSTCNMWTANSNNAMSILPSRVSQTHGPKGTNNNSVCGTSSRVLLTAATGGSTCSQTGRSLSVSSSQAAKTVTVGSSGGCQSPSPQPAVPSGCMSSVQQLEKALQQTIDRNAAGARPPVTLSSCSHPRPSTPTTVSSSSLQQLDKSLQHFIEKGADLDMNKLDSRLIQVLAWQRLQQLQQESSMETEINSQPTNVQPKKGIINNLLAPHCSQEVPARALLCPLTGKGQPVPMTYRTLHIGANMEACLSQFGQCNFVSGKHACIFYDEMSKHYELLNYSEHGTTVDNVLYSCDFSDKTATTPKPTKVIQSVRSLIDKARKVPEAPPDEKQFMTSHANKMRKPCNCKGSSSSLIGGSGAGWEGTALLHHGSYIKVGCLQFVFSIVDQATRDPVLERRREGASLLKSQLQSPSLP